MAKGLKTRRWSAAEVRKPKTAARNKTLARKKAPAAAVVHKLRTKAGRYVITSPAKSATNVTSWSQAFGHK
jgi:hypothetical protein